MTTREQWMAALGREWAAQVASTDAALGPYGEEARKRLGLSEGERVLDLGCGAGTSTLSLAKDVGPSGGVTAIDVSPDLVRMVRERTADNPAVEVIEADAETYDFGEARFDALFSRFGCMFFDDPPAAWANVHRALKPEARVSLVAWRTLEDNDWARVPLEAAEDLPEDSASGFEGPSGPGPFAWADPKTFEPLLEGAGFREVVREKIEKKVPYGAGEADDPLDRAVEMITRIGPFARRLSRVEDESARSKAVKKLRKLLKPYKEDDAVMMTGRAWLITARA